MVMSLTKRIHTTDLPGVGSANNVGVIERLHNGSPRWEDNNMTASLKETEERIGNFINKCPSCSHKQYTYTRECEKCRFSWVRYYNQLKNQPLDTPYTTQEEP